MAGQHPAVIWLVGFQTEETNAPNCSQQCVRYFSL